ncbi:MAG TPA: hypothetical protein VHU80_15590, partial [Polyangiaceae bacterium]|nr:hypothetical protein [Polyangiaceae bacterium]
CAIVSMVSRGVVDPLSVLLGKWYILRTLPDPPPPWVDLVQSGIDVRTLVHVSLGAAVAETRKQIRTGMRPGTEQHREVILKATSRSVQELIARDRTAFNHAASALGRLAERTAKDGAAR